MQPQQPFAELRPKVVLGIAAHPDDLDFGTSGTLAKFAQQGAEVHYLQLTDGSKGSDDPNMTRIELINIRKAEQQAACEIVGGTSVTFLDHADGELEVTLQLKSEIVKVIRQLKPDVVITMDPTMVYAADYGIINHSDHRAAGQAALDAVYPFARDRLAFPQLAAQGYQPHKVKTVLIVNFETSNYSVDITSTIDTKLRAAKAHVSQCSDEFAGMLKNMAQARGEQAGFDYAESYIRLDIER